MKNIIKALVVSFILFNVISCAEKEKLNNIGPNICPSDAFVFPENELILDGVDIDSKADLSSQGINIKALFSEKVKWTITITSNLSSKLYEGNSDSINVWWFGNSDKLPLFDVGECKIVLEIACLKPIEKTISLTKKPNFKNLNSDYGILLRDWDKNGKFPVADVMFTVADGWRGMNGAESYLEYFNAEPSPAGGYYATFYGKSPTLTWYHGGHSFPVTNLQDLVSSTNMDSVYLNVFVQGHGLTNSDCEIGFQTASGSYFHVIPVDWTGWKLVSTPLSSLKILSGPNVGNKLSTLSGINNVVIQLGSNPERSTEAKTSYDFLILTVGKPFLKE